MAIGGTTVLLTGFRPRLLTRALRTTIRLPGVREGGPPRDPHRGAAPRNTGRQWHTQGGVGMSDKVVHFEIPADDVERAQAFYRDAFGWTINAMPEMGYTIVMTTESDEAGTPVERGAINGGMLQRQGQISSPVITIGVDDVEQALRRVEDLGGKTVIDKQDVGGMGFSAYFSDPEGNIVGLWQSVQSA
jgi:predicted enzyme related to lactoylglutathione lyase